MTRIKTSTATFTSETQFKNCVDEIAALQLEIDAEVAEYNEQKALADKKFKAAIQRKKERLNQKLATAEMYATHNRTELLGEKQTSETRLADFGFRKSPGVIKQLNRKWSVGASIEALKAAGKTVCIKVTERLDKQAVKSQIPEADQAKYGLRTEYPEDFWIEAKKAAEPTEKRLTT